MFSSFSLSCTEVMADSLILFQSQSSHFLPELAGRSLVTLRHHHGCAPACRERSVPFHVLDAVEAFYTRERAHHGIPGSLSARPQPKLEGLAVPDRATGVHPPDGQSPDE